MAFNIRKFIVAAAAALIMQSTAWAAPEKPTVLLNDNEISISGNDFSEGDTVTCVILSPDYEELAEVDEENVLNAFYYTADTAADSNGEYSFKFKLLDNDKAGYYKVYVGGKNGEISEAEQILFLNITGRKNLISEFAKSENAAEAQTYYETSNDLFEKLGISYQMYRELSSEGKLNFVSSLYNAQKDYYTAAADGSEVIDTDKFNVLAKELLVLNWFNYADISTDGIKRVYESYNDILKAEAEPAEKMKAEDWAVIVPAITAQRPFENVTGVSIALNREMITALQSGMHYANFENYLDKYNGILAFDVSTFKNRVSASGKEYIAKQICGVSRFESYKSFKAKFDAVCSEAASLYPKNSSNGSQGSRPSGSSGSSGSSGGGMRPWQGSNAAGSASDNNTNNSTSTTEKIFDDVDSDFWANDSIKTLKDMGVASGTGDGSFYPNNSVTREEFLKLALAAFGIKGTGNEDCNFDDVARDSWFYDYVAAAVSRNFVQGISDTSFGSGQNITRQDMAVILYRILESMQINIGDSTEILFSDADSISEYAKSPIGAMYNGGIISGMENNRFCPQEKATRAQACEIIYKALRKAEVIK